MDYYNIKPRLQWVDTAKGICILLVILYHTTEHIMDLSPALRDMLRATRMPLYYTIAGLFVSIKSPCVFLNKKINRLVVPFCFFILLGNFVSFIKSVIDGTDFTYYSPLYYVITSDPEGKFINSPVWFLFSLFDVYLIFMLIEKISCYIGKYKTTVKIVLSLLAGFCGIRCNRMGIDLPLFLDSSLTATPFLIFGHIIMSETNMFKEDFNKWTYLSLSILLIGTALLIAQGDIDYRLNNYKTSIFHIYVPAFCGVIGILMLTKSIGTIPVITKIGRYSIVYLGTHYLFFKDLRLFFETHICQQQMILIDLLIFFCTVVISMILCWILLRVVPCLIAQKDCVFIGDIKKFIDK